MRNMLCSICEHETQLLEQYDHAPHCIMGQYNRSELDLRKLELYVCESCGHMQIPAYITNDYYEEYSMGSYWGASFRALRKQQAERLAQLTSSHEHYMDIGCGVGHYLELAAPYFRHVVGVEPSTTGVQACKEKGFHVVQDYFHAALEFHTAFDAITIIEVMEHIEQPLILLQAAANKLSDDGVILVEVPNGQRILEKRLFYNLCTDHIQYFSVSSLAALAQRAGLSVIAVQEAADPNLLELYVRKKKQAVPSFTQKREQFLLDTLSNLQEQDKVAAWGAGAESVCFIAMLQQDIKLATIFDSDKAKHGHSLGGISISEPTEQQVNAYDAIILFANAHRKQIEQQLEQLHYKGKLICFSLD